jgi:predicted nucleic acid-binding protein
VGFTLDTGALIALERGKARAWHFVHLSIADSIDLRAPADVLAEFWRGRPRSRAIKALVDDAVHWIDVTPSLAKRAGEALALGGPTPSAVDALVATVAAIHGDIVLTSDPSDFIALRRYYAGLKVLGV